MYFSDVELVPCGKPIIVATHMRSGTHLTLDVLRRQFQVCDGWKLPGEANDYLYLALDTLLQNPGKATCAKARTILQRARRPLVKVHWTKPDLTDLEASEKALAVWLHEKGDFIHVVRNPYKVMASLWAWEHQRGLPDDLWLRKSLSYWVEHTLSWSARFGTLLVRSEDIVREPLGSIKKLGAFLHETPISKHPPLPCKLRGFWHSRACRLFSMRPQSTAILIRQEVTPPAVLFDRSKRKIFAEVAGPTMESLGYSLDLAEV